MIGDRVDRPEIGRLGIEQVQRRYAEPGMGKRATLEFRFEPGDKIEGRVRADLLIWGDPGVELAAYIGENAG